MMIIALHRILFTKQTKNKRLKADFSCLNFNKFVVFRVSFADEKYQKSPQVKTLNAGHFFGRVFNFLNVASNTRFRVLHRWFEHERTIIGLQRLLISPHIHVSYPRRTTGQFSLGRRVKTPPLVSGASPKHTPGWIFTTRIHRMDIKGR